jgi:hypothetical protein
MGKKSPEIVEVKQAIKSKGIILFECDIRVKK